MKPRTAAAARMDGTYFKLDAPGWAEAAFPQAETPDEAAVIAIAWNPVPLGTVIPAWRITGEYTREPAQPVTITRQHYAQAAELAGQWDQFGPVFAARTRRLLSLAND